MTYGEYMRSNPPIPKPFSKNEFRDLWKGDRVASFSDTRFTEGTVIKVNSNGSQVLIKWDNGTEKWHGRLSLMKPINPTKEDNK